MVDKEKFVAEVSSAAQASEKNSRKVGLTVWAKTQLGHQGEVVGTSFCIEPCSDDASFRRYFRANHGANTYVFVDAPPSKEDNHAFVKIAKLLRQEGVQVPMVYAVDYTRGFMMLSDEGDALFLDALRLGRMSTDELFLAALQPMLRMQAMPGEDVPFYDHEKLQSEMDLFHEWFLDAHLGFDLDLSTKALLSSTYACLLKNAQVQPQVFVHRDFHSRNLMFNADQSIVVIDFQDAVKGPITYDLVSLLKDCYWQFPREQVKTWVRQFWEALSLEVDFDEFLRWFDLMGMQRHLKCAGIFCRLSLRDGKENYLNDIPLVLHYLAEAAAEYEEFKVFSAWLSKQVLPIYAAKGKS